MKYQDVALNNKWINGQPLSLTTLYDYTHTHTDSAFIHVSRYSIKINSIYMY